MSTTGIQILENLKSSVHYKENFIVPVDFTQEGLVKKIGVTRANISRTLRQLTEQGFVSAELKHVFHKKRRCKTYHLTRKGIMELDYCQNTLESETRTGIQTECKISAKKEAPPNIEQRSTNREECACMEIQ